MSYLQPTRVAIRAGKIVISARMFEGLATTCQLLQLRAAAPGELSTAGDAIVGLWGAVMATGTAGPELVADIVRISTPACLHLGKKFTW